MESEEELGLLPSAKSLKQKLFLLLPESCLILVWDEMGGVKL